MSDLYTVFVEVSALRERSDRLRRLIERRARPCLIRELARVFNAIHYLEAQI